MATEAPRRGALAYWPALVVLAICVAAVAGLGQLVRTRDLSVLEAQVRSELQTSRARLAAVAESTFGPTVVLATQLRLQQGLDERNFRAAADLLIRDQPQLRSVAAAPGNVVALIHPVEGNERALGLDYRSLPTQWVQVQRARQLGTALIFAPVQLVQGGMGVIQRRPIFLPGPDGQPRYWGVVSVVADLERFVARAGLSGHALDLALVERHQDGHLGTPIWGSPALIEQAHLREDLQLPGATWTLIGRPRQGWAWSPWQGWWLWLSLAVSLLVLGMTVALIRRRLQLAQRTAALELEVQARQRSQQAAETANARLQLLLRTASDWYWEQDAQLNLSYLSEPSRRDPNDAPIQLVLGQRRWEHPLRVPGLPTDEAWAAHRTQLERREPFRDFEYALRRPNGGLTWVSVSGEPVFDEHGAFVGYRGTGRTVTALHEARQALDAAHRALSAAHERLRAVFDAALDVAIIAVNAEGRITEFNRGAQALLGYGADEVLGEPPTRFHLDAELQSRRRQLEAQLDRPLHTAEVVMQWAQQGRDDEHRWTFVRRDGRLLPVALRVNRMLDPQGHPVGYLATAIDLSAQERAQAQQKATALRLQAVFDSASALAIVVVNLDGRIETMNRGAEQVLGCTVEQAQGRLALEFHVREELREQAQRVGVRIHEVIARQAAGLDGGHTRHWTLQRADTGALVRVRHTSTLLRDAEGRHVGFVAIALDVTEEERAEQALLAEQARMRSVLAAPVQTAIIAIDLEGRVTLFNRGAELMLGYTEAEMLGKPPLQLHLPEELEARRRAMSEDLGRPVDLRDVFVLQARRELANAWEWTYRHKDGHHLTVSQSLACLRNADGEVTGYLGMMVDISERVAAERALRDAKARLEAMLDASLEIGILLTDPAGRIVTFNRGAERLTGYSAAEVQGRAATQLHEPEELRRRLAELERELGRPCHALELFAHQAKQPPGYRTRPWTYLRKDGSPLHGSVSVAEVLGEQDRLLGYLAIGRDIGPQLAQEQELREARDRLQAVLDGAQEVAILVVNDAGRITLFNRGAEHLFGYAQHEMLGRPSMLLQDRLELERRRAGLSQQLGHALRLPEALTHSVRQGSSALSHWTFVRKGGERFPGALRLSALPDPGGGPPSYLAMVLDISEQERAQAQLEQLNRELEQRVEQRSAELKRTLSTLTLAQDELLRAEKLAALGSLVAGVAHELNTPLGTCLTAASTLHDRSQDLRRDLEAQQLRKSTLQAYVQDSEAMAELLLRGLHSASELVTHFKQLSVDQTSEHRRPFQLATVVDDVLTVMRPQLKHSRLRIETDIALDATIDAYPGELGRLLTNLVQNAQLHAFEPLEEGRLAIQARALDAERFELVVSDNGKGMAPDVRRRAFDPFFTTKLGKGGSGLGLNIVYNIATGVLGGEVELHSAPGEGSRFVFRLPFRAPQRLLPGTEHQPQHPSVPAPAPLAGPDPAASI